MPHQPKETAMPTTQEIAQDLVALCREGKFEASGEKYWADDVVSLEAGEGDMARVAGKVGVRAKGEWWVANHEVHGLVVEGPYVNGDEFIVRFKMDITPKGGERITLDEVGLYTLKNGLIAQEQFFYAG
jgi:hypothetical protein